jgi:uncharacterized protein (DUF2336 family)
MAQGSSNDIGQLYQLARDKTIAGRKSLVNAVSDLFFDSHELLTDREKALMTDILRQLLHDMEMSVRRELAERLAKTENVPHELVITLANDKIEVAYPILRESELLHDTDLIEIIHHRTLQHQLAIAMRKTLNESVTDALTETGREDVIKTMLENPDAKLSKTTMEYLVDQSKRVDSYQNPLLARSDLEPELVKRMYWWVSAATRQHIIANFDIDQTELDASLEATAKDLIGEASTELDKVSRAAEIADRLAEIDEISPQLLIEVLRQGEVPLFEAMYAKLTGLRPRLVSRIVYEPGGEALAVVCKAVGIDKPNFASLFMLTRKAHAKDKVISPRELTPVLEFFENIKPQSAAALLERWRRDPDYLDSIRALESPEGKDDKN